jgi:hypothetical protein
MVHQIFNYLLDFNPQGKNKPTEKNWWKIKEFVLKQ